MPLITGGGIPQTRGVINGRVAYKHPFIEVIAKFVGGILAPSTGLSLGREGPSVQIGSYVDVWFLNGESACRRAEIIVGGGCRCRVGGCFAARWLPHCWL